MERRAFISGITVGLLAAPLVVRAQLTGRIPRIGVLLPAEPASPTEPDASAFRQRLHALGYVEGQNVVVEYRHAHGKAKLHTELVAQLVRLPVNVMVVGSGAATLAAKKVTQTVPIVMVGGGDPVRSGIVASLARPSGNITGLVFESAPDVYGKYVELLAESVPRLSRITGIVDPRNAYPDHWGAAHLAATRRGIVLQQVDIGKDAEVPGAFTRITDQRAGAVIVFSGPFLYFLRTQISELALKNGLPTISGYREGPGAGC